MAVNYKSLVEDVGRMDDAKEFLREVFEKKQLRPADFDMGRLFTECYGFSAFEQCRGGDLATKWLIEGPGATTSSAFSQITGQVVFAAILDAYKSEEFVFTGMIPEMPSRTMYPEKLAGITELGDAALVRDETFPYARAGVGQNYITAPLVKDRGLIVALTREAVFEDKTGDLMTRAGAVGKAIGISVEKRAIDAVIDENAGAVSALAGGHRYHWLDNSIATYGDSSGNHSWDNLAGTNALLSWPTVEAAELLLAAMVDPFTGEPIMALPKHLIVTPQLLHTAKQIIRATENRLQIGGYPTSGNLITRVSPNTIESYTIVSSRLLAARLGTDTSWFLGDIGRALKRKICWPMDTREAPPNSHEEFERQIIQQWRANEASGFFWFEPRFMVKSTAA